MSVVSGAALGEPNPVDAAYDSGDDWEIGVGDLIIDLDADLEKDRQKLELGGAGTLVGSATAAAGGNRKEAATAAASASAAAECVATTDCSGNINPDIAAGTSLTESMKLAAAAAVMQPTQTSPEKGGKSKVKRSKNSKNGRRSPSSAAAAFGGAERGGAKKVVVVDGQSVRSGDVSASSLTTTTTTTNNTINTSSGSGSSSSRSSKEEKPTRAGRGGSKKAAAAAAARKEKEDVLQFVSGGGALSGGGGGGSSPQFRLGSKGGPCHSDSLQGNSVLSKEVSCRLSDFSKATNLDSGLLGNCIIVKQEDDADNEDVPQPAAKKVKSEKADSQFVMPAPPPPPTMLLPSSPPCTPSLVDSLEVEDPRLMRPQQQQQTLSGAVGGGGSGTTLCPMACSAGGVCASTLVEAEPEEQILIRTRTVGVSTCEAASVTEPDCLGPCEPGTCINLEGIVWHETESMLVVNVTWRNKSYVGTLLDCTKHEWAPPRFCDSPTSDLEARGGRGRGKRARAGSNASQNEINNPGEPRAPHGKGRGTGGANGGKGRRGSLTANGQWNSSHVNTGDDVKASPNGKRKGRPASDLPSPQHGLEEGRPGKRLRPSPRTTNNNLMTPSVINSQARLELTPLESQSYKTPSSSVSSPALIDCPHPNCNKKYRHINGLKYHQAHAHLKNENKQEDGNDNEDKSTESEHSSSPVKLKGCDLNGSSASLSNGSQCLDLLKEKSSSLPVSPLDTSSPETLHTSHSKGKGLSKRGIRENGTNVNGDVNPSEDNASGSPLSEMPKLEVEGPFGGKSPKEESTEKSKRVTSIKIENKTSPKPKAARPIAPAPPPPQLVAMPGANYSNSPSAGNAASIGIHAATVIPTVIKTMPKSPPLKPIQPKPASIPEIVATSPNITPTKEKKKKDKKKSKDRDCKETVSLKLSLKVIGRSDDGKDGKEFSDPLTKDYVVKTEGMFNGSAEVPEKRIASIKAEAAKVYNFTDNAPSPSIGSACRVESARTSLSNGRLTPLHAVIQNGLEGLMASNTNSPAYSDISDDGEDREGEHVKKVPPTKVLGFNDAELTTLDTRAIQSDDQTSFYSDYNAYYSPSSKLQSNVNAPNDSMLTQIGQIKKEDDGSGCGSGNGQMVDGDKADLTSQHQSVIQQGAPLSPRSLYYQQYAYGYGYYDPRYRSQPFNSSPNSDPPTAIKHNEKKSKHRSKDLSKSGEGKRKSVPSATASAPKSALNFDTAKGTGSEVLKGGSVFSEELPVMSTQQEEGLAARQTQNHIPITEELKPTTECADHSGMDQSGLYKQEFDVNQWQQLYYAQYLEQHRAEEERWKKMEKKHKEANKEGERSESKGDSRDGKRPLSGSNVTDAGEDKDDGKSSSASKDSQPGVNASGSFLQYMSQNPYAQMYDPNHPAYRGVPPMMMHFYAGGYLSPSLYYTGYGKMSGQEEGECERQTGGKSMEGKTSDQQLSRQSPNMSDKSTLEKDKEGGGEKGKKRLTPPPQRHSHHSPHTGVGYPGLSAQYEHYPGVPSGPPATAQTPSSSFTSQQRTECKGTDEAFYSIM
ncbi:zinc finger protein 608-like isoform X2 [Lampetra planeri]